MKIVLSPTLISTPSKGPEAAAVFVLGDLAAARFGFNANERAALEAAVIKVRRSMLVLFICYLLQV
jgi:hypothetical protein